LLGNFVLNLEPVTWAEELIEPARAADHPRILSLYVVATWCWTLGRIDEAVRYSDAGQVLLLSGSKAEPPGFEMWLAGVFNMIGQARRTVEWCRTLLARHPDQYALTSSGLVSALMRSGDRREAKAVAQQFLDAADSLSNPWARSYASLLYGMAWCDDDPASAREVLRSGLAIARESGNRYNESHMANVLGRLETQQGDPLAAIEYLSFAVHNYHDSGNFEVIRVPLASLAALLHRLGRHESGAIIAGHAFSPFTRGWVPELGTAIAQLRDVLGNQRYESLARTGEAMTTSAMAAYAYDQIDWIRAELEQLR
jgi:tetratricopeptide (TPR) repeat protein